MDRLLLVEAFISELLTFFEATAEDQKDNDECEAGPASNDNENRQS